MVESIWSPGSRRLDDWFDHILLLEHVNHRAELAMQVKYGSEGHNEATSRERFSGGRRLRLGVVKPVDDEFHPDL